MKLKLKLCLLVIGLLVIGAEAQSTVTVRFRSGASSGSYNGSIRGGRYLDYVISGKQGQRMTVKLARRTGADVYFNVIRRGSEVAIADDAREVTDWSGQLPETGAYAVRVYMPKAARLGNRSSTFRLSVTVDAAGAGEASTGVRTVYYVCESARLRADFKGGTPPTVRLRYGTQDFELPLEPSGSGSKYEYNNQSFWVKGNEAMLESKVLNATCSVTK